MPKTTSGLVSPFTSPPLATALLFLFLLAPAATFLSQDKGGKFLTQYVRDKSISTVNFFVPAKGSAHGPLPPKLLKTLSFRAGVPAAQYSVSTARDVTRALATTAKEGILSVAVLNGDLDLEMLAEIASEGPLMRGHLWLVIGSPALLQNSSVQPYMALDNMVMFADSEPDSDIIRLYDVYETAPHAAYRIRQVGQWNASQAPLSQKVMLPRDFDTMLQRTNMTGLHLRCVTLQQSPFVYLDVDSKTGKVTLVKGHAVDVWKLFQTIFGFTYTCHQPADGSWGTKRDGKWTGLVAEVVEGQADVVVAPLDNTVERAEAVDFAIGLRNTASRLVLKRRALMDSTWTTFTQQFTKEAWGGTVALMVLVPPFLTLVTKLSPGERERVSLRDAYVITIGALAYQGAEVAATSLSGRIVFLVIFLSTLLIYCYYTSALVASLTFASTIQPIESLNDVVKSGHYELGFMAKIAIESEFESSHTSPFQEAWERLIKPNLASLPTTNTVGIERVEQGGYVFIIDESIFTFEFSNRCDVFTLPPQYFSKPTGFAFAKGSPYVKIFNHHLMKMRNGGILDRSWEQLQPPKSLCQSAGVVSLNPTQVFTAFLLLMLGAGLSVVLLPLEKLWHRSFGSESNSNLVTGITDKPTLTWGIYG